MKQQYKVIGLMSGTSLDGVDIAFCRFNVENGKWNYFLEKAETIAYTSVWKKKFSELENATAFDLVLTNVEYGAYLGNLVKSFSKKYFLKPDFIASHGHTIFHQINKKITFQLGSGAAISAACNFPVICDFRSLDVALGGQGAPLVPIGDALLFSEYDFCLNLGGIANVSFQKNKKRIAFDICPVNIVVNYLCEQLKIPFDDKGKIGKTGKTNKSLLAELNQILFYKISSDKPKSLGKEWVLKNIFPIMKKYKISVNDKIRTFYEHIAIQIAKALEKEKAENVLVTGGGAYNNFLMQRIIANSQHKFVIPEKKVIEFKEAIIFAFLGVLRWRNEINCLQSVTGSTKNNVGGC
ncbi:MAG TPA: anhydro-N-acetylmuramic acid kinase, partial [Bacteroidia bacterium]|nr:anhydro-N-acetylmuramic acid kinase [Bacteroidia bacterium]